MPVVNVNDEAESDPSVLSECVSVTPTVELGCEFRTKSNVSVLPASVTVVDPADSVTVISAASSSIIVRKISIGIYPIKEINLNPC